MQSIQLSPNLYIVDTAFGSYNKEIVHDLLLSIDRNFSDSLSIRPFSTCRCEILYHHELAPRCCQMENFHLILLSAKENYWCQWCYQFAHEYCHHLINGGLSGSNSGLKWFEETICELSSMYHLNMLQKQWADSDNCFERIFVPSLREYLDDLRSKNQQLFDQVNFPGWLQRLLPVLSDNCYHREYYNAIAVHLLPLFIECPALWKIILHFGDMCQRQSIGELLDYLQSKADDSYSASLQKMCDYLRS